MISERISDDIPPQMKILNMVIPILMHFCSFKRCKQHNAARHLMKCDVINAVKLLPTVYCRIYCRKFLTLSNQKKRYKRNRIRMLRDCTTKKRIHIYGVKLATEKKTFTVGLRQISNTTTINLFDTTSDIIDSAEQAQQDGKTILPIVTNTMTDRCATELEVNKLLNELKKDISRSCK